MEYYYRHYYLEDEFIRFNIGVYVSDEADFCGRYYLYIDDNDGRFKEQ